MRWFPLFVVFALAAPGCSEKSALTEFESYKTQVCACKDSACAQALDEKHKGLEQKLDTMTGTEKEKATALVMAAFACTIELTSDDLDKEMKAADEEIERAFEDFDKEMKKVDEDLDRAIEDMKKVEAEIDAEMDAVMKELDDESVE